MKSYHNYISLFYSDFFQFQFLYPFILDPMWMETNIEKQDVRALSIASRVFNPVTAVHENRTVSEESENVGLDISPSSVSPLPAKEMQPDSVDVSHKVWLKWFVFERSWIVCFWFIVCLFQFLLWSVLPRTKCSLQTASSLPSTSSIVMPASDSKKLAEPCRTTSVFVPPEEKADIITSTSLAEPETDATVGTPPTSEVCLWIKTEIVLISWYDKIF